MHVHFQLVRTLTSALSAVAFTRSLSERCAALSARTQRQRTASGLFISVCYSAVQCMCTERARTHCFSMGVSVLGAFFKRQFSAKPIFKFSLPLYGRQLSEKIFPTQSLRPSLPLGGVVALLFFLAENLCPVEEKWPNLLWEISTEKLF